MRDALDRSPAQVCAVGLSGQMHGVVLARGDSRPLRPAIISLDRRAEAESRAYRALPAHLLSSLGNPLVPGMAGPILHWLTTNEPSVVAEADWALQPKDWLRLRLVGEAASEPSDASGTLLFDLAGNSWAATARRCPRVVSRVCSHRSVHRAPWPGLAAPPRTLLVCRRTPVVYGSADTAAALVGTGISEVGAVQLTVGSAAQVVTLRREPVPDHALCYHVFASARPGQWYALAAVQAAGVVLSWALDALGATWEEAYELLDVSPSGANGVSSSPFGWSRSPSMNAAARAAFRGLELRHNRADMYAPSLRVWPSRSSMRLLRSPSLPALPSCTWPGEVRSMTIGANSCAICWAKCY